MERFSEGLALNEAERIINDSVRLQREGGIQDAVSISIYKNPGSMDCKKEFYASSPSAGLMGIAILVERFAEATGIPLAHAVALLTTVLLAPAPETM